MGYFSELAHHQALESDEQLAMHQLSLEREELAKEAAKRLAQGLGGRQEIEILCREAGIDSPYR